MSSKNKHYTVLEKKIFVEILNDFKHIIEIKKSDTSTLHDKEVAWNEICKRYNESSMISQERTLQQLKKLWTNLKQTQRDLLTREKQARLATGGGPPPPEINIDPDVATIAPHLITTAPVIFTSNMTKNEIDENSKNMLNILQDDTNTILYKNNNDKVNDEIIEIQEDTITKKALDEENEKYEFFNEVNSVKRKVSENIHVQTRKLTKVQKNVSENLDSDENAVKIERIKKIIEDEREMADLRKTHENRMIIMKENFHTELYALEIQTATAKAELAELELQKEKEKYMRL